MPRLGLARTHWADRIAELDADRDHAEIARLLAVHEFPWDTLQSLSFALYRTYAVPSIGKLLDETAEFTERVQKRYDDTGMLLEEILEHSLQDPRGRSAVRRINQMHAMYDISNDDMLYVLATFVVMPVRWNADHGYRPITQHELRAMTIYYNELGRHMAIKDMPTEYADWERLLDDYEREHFAFHPGGRRVADSTLALMTTFPPNNLAPKWLVKRFAYALMDDPLLKAFRYPRPTAIERRLAKALMRLRARAIALMPARRKPKWVRDFGYFRSYPGGWSVDELGTFAQGAHGCPVAQQRRTD